MLRSAAKEIYPVIYQVIDNFGDIIIFRSYEASTEPPIEDFRVIFKVFDKGLL